MTDLFFSPAETSDERPATACQPCGSAACRTTAVNGVTGITSYQRECAINLGVDLANRFVAKGDLMKAVHAINLTRQLMKGRT